MAREIPEVVRAAAGLAATVLDEARKLPETLPGLPVRVIGFAMQKAMWAQQQYAGLVARGDELFTGLRGEDEPGLATFDDDLPEDVAPATGAGYRESAFDRAEVPADEDLLSGLPEDDVALPDVGAAEEADADVRAEFEDNRAEEALDEIALDELVDDETAGLPPEPSPAEVVEAVEEITAQVEDADVLAADAAETAAGADEVDVVTPDGEVATVEATVTDEGVAAPEAEAVDEGGTTVAAATGPSTSAPATAPVEGYDAWSIAQLRGRLRGYQAKTVVELVAYEEATRSREPYLRMLRNRLEKLDEQAVEASPLAPRGA
ncbi:lipid droplet-associated protein [Petropleomorpha daqingensis]|uniref:Lipid droplet-associated protein n=1 Tax=Petropleomorpha daqingensis TaxID=2026353 RepID=A0A853CII6_9ACTN|nr:lipid droplet-associated protein [Petropleomorpha daqingensis]NYJ06372.1 hypothetical protein [Petropleomorpha daqingensis]